MGELKGKIKTSKKKKGAELKITRGIDGSLVWGTENDAGFHEIVETGERKTKQEGLHI